MLSFDTIDQVASVRWSGQIPSHDDVTRAHRATESRLQREPLLRQYFAYLMREAAAGRKAYNVQPWMAKGEKLLAALLCVTSEASAASRIESDDWPLSPSPAHAAIIVATKLLLAQPYLWRQRMLRIADESPLPDHVISRDLLPYPYMFWSYETAFTTRGGGQNTNWMLVTHATDGFEVFFDLTDGGRREGSRISGGSIKYGRRYPQDFTGEEQESAAQVLRRLSFLSSPSVRMDVQRVPRQWRRRWARDAVDAVHPDEAVHVVVLRRDAARAVDAYERAVREHRHQWWVAGHQRAQWYPSEQAHHVIWIAPYLKGPLDAPLLEKIYSVQR